MCSSFQDILTDLLVFIIYNLITFIYIYFHFVTNSISDPPRFTWVRLQWECRYRGDRGHQVRQWSGPYLYGVVRPQAATASVSLSRCGLCTQRQSVDLCTPADRRGMYLWIRTGRGCTCDMIKGNESDVAVLRYWQKNSSILLFYVMWALMNWF